MNSCIFIPKRVFPNKKNDRCLFPDELYLYSLLYRWRSIYDHLIAINVDGISELCPYKFMTIQAKGNDTRNKTKIKQLLSNLCETKYLEINKDIKTAKNNELLRIHFLDRAEYDFYTIAYDLFDQFHHPLEYFIYCYIDTNGSEGKAISYNKWSEITNTSRYTLDRVLDKMNSDSFRPRIWKIPGEYYQEKGEYRQHKNVYYTRPREDIKAQWYRLYGAKQV